MTIFRFSQLIVLALALIIPLGTAGAAAAGADWLDVCREAGDFKAPKPEDISKDATPSADESKLQHEAYVGRLELAMRARKYDEGTKGAVRSLCTAYNYGFLDAMKLAAAIADAAPPDSASGAANK